MINKKQLEIAITNALKYLYSHDTFLIEEDVNERSISFRLAMYLRVEVDKIENGWNVDCEYNRIGTSKLEGEYFSKKMDLPVRTDITSEDTKARTVFPDINIHHRGKEGKENNLLVIEIKKGKTNDEYDFKKLEEYGKQLDYQWGVYLNIGLTETLNTWWKAGKIIIDV